MKVKDIKGKRERIYKECINLQKLEHLFKNDSDLRKEIEKASGCDLNLDELLTEVRMHHFILLEEIDTKIDNAEIQE